MRAEAEQCVVACLDVCEARLVPGRHGRAWCCGTGQGRAREVSAADVGSRNGCAGDRLHTRREAEASSGGEAAVWGAGPLTVRRGLLGAAGVPVQGSARGSARVAFTCGSSCCQRYRALAVAGQKNCSATTTMAVVAEQFFTCNRCFVFGTVSHLTASPTEI